MNIFITGANGFIGSGIKETFLQSGHTVVGIPHQLFAQEDNQLTIALCKADIVINLAGENIFGRWTVRKKQRILSSRQETTRKLVQAIHQIPHKPQLFISASAVGIYKSDVYSDEDETELGEDFLAQVAMSWEKEAGELRNTRIVILRMGMVIGKNGGVFSKMSAPMRAKISIIPGDGWQPFPLIHLNDVAGFIGYAIHHTDVSGIYNLTTPETPTLWEFIESMKNRFQPWVTFKIPKWLLSIVFSEASVLFTQGANVTPKRLLESGYKLRYGTVAEIVNATI